MISSKDLIGQFKAAPWKRPDEVEAFVVAADTPATQDLLKLVDVLSARVGDAQAQQSRLAAFSRFVIKNPDKALFVPLVRALKVPDSALRAALVDILPKVNSVTEHAELVAHLREKDPSLRQAAAQALAAMGGGKTTFELLTQACAAREFAGRTEAMQVLVSFAKHLAVPALQSVLQIGTPQEKLVALRHLGDPKVTGKDPVTALKAIATALTGQPEQITTQAIASFSALCSEDDWFTYIGPFLDSDTGNYVRAAILGLRRFGSPRGVAALQRKLRAGPRQVRIAVVNTLELIGTDEVLPCLVEAVGHRQLPVRQRGAEVLQKLGIEGKVEAPRTILWLLRSPDVNVRRTAADLIRSVSDPDQKLWPRLISLLRDEDFWVRERVMDAIIELGGASLLTHVVQMVADPSDVIRRFAVTVLGRLKDPRALRALMGAAQNDPDWWVKETAVEAVALINDARAVPHLVNLLQDVALQPVILQALMRMDSRTAAPQVAALMASDNPDVRLLAVQFLAKFEANEHGELLATLFDDGDPRVRKAARDLLHRWSVVVQGGTAAIPLLDRLLLRVAEQEGDDLLVAPGRPAYMKKLGRTSPITDGPLSVEQVEAVLLPHLTTEQIMALQVSQDVDYSHEVKREGLRFRANVFKEMGGLAGVFRRIKGELPDIDQLGVPPLVKAFGEMKNGLVLVGGPTGSGKSTTLAAIIDYINRTYSNHIISLEDPIEVVHPRKLSLVNQREIGTHSKSFARALRSTLRNDPNVILVGEMRDLTTLEFTVTAAETGHLVFGTVHTVSAATTVDRMVSAFPSEKQAQVRSTLADSLRAVVCQHLLPEKNGKGRVLAMEILLNNGAVSNLIRKGKSFQLPSIIATSAEQGMRLMDTDLMRLLKEGRITAEDAYVKATTKKDFEPFLEAAKAAAAKEAK